MSRVEYDEIREERIEMEIIVDAYNPAEQAMGWYYYLDNNLDFPFKAKWLNRGGKSSDREVVVLEMSSEEECQNEMFVEVLYREGEAEDEFSARLYDIEPMGADSNTQEAIADWHYWCDRGYELSE
jgi:hypothetical protein